MTLSANEVNKEFFMTPFFQSALSQDTAAMRALEMGNAAAARFTHWDLMAAVMAATAEGSDPGADTNLSPTNVPITPARQAIRFSLGDDEAFRFSGSAALQGAEATLLSMNISSMPSEQEVLAMGMIGAACMWGFINRCVVLTRNLASGFATVAGVAMAPLTKAVFEAAVDAGYARGNRGEAIWLDTNSGWAAVAADYAALLGAGQFSAGAQTAVDRGGSQVTGPIYRGVRHATMAAMPDDGAGSTYGAIMWPRALKIGTATPRLGGNAELVGVIGDPNAPLVTLERRRIEGSTSRLVGVCWTGVSEDQDLGGTTLIHLT
jgi:hypothetical protein